MDDFASASANKFELVSYADDRCIFFTIDRHYDFELIKVQIIHSFNLTHKRIKIQEIETIN